MVHQNYKCQTTNCNDITITISYCSLLKPRERTIMTSNHVKNNPNSSPLSPLSVNLKHSHQQPSTREEPLSDLFSPKGRRPRRRHSARHHRGESSTSRVTSSSSKYPKTPCPSPNYPVKKKSIQPSIISHTNTKSRHHLSEPTMAVRLRRMKRRLLQEHINKSE